MFRIVATTVFVAVFVLVAPLAASAQDNPTDKRIGLSPQKAPEAGDALSGLADGRLGVGMIDGDVFMTINIGTALTFGKLGIGVQVPLRLNLSDKGKIRKEDWDEVSDYARVIRFLSWGSPGESIYARIGMLTGTTLGHGTIVDRYYNTIDADHFQSGVQLELDFDLAGGQFFLDNFMDPEIFGLRGYVRPFQFFQAPKWAHGITVGATLAMDTAAPLDYADDGTGKRRLNPDGEFITTTSTSSLFGVDLGWEIAATSWVSLTPYIDANVLLQTGGAGMHLGLLSNWNVLGVVRIGARVEYRALDHDYTPNYINSWYEVERFDFAEFRPTPDEPVEPRTKLRHFLLQDAEEGDTLHGWHATLDLTILDTFTIGGIFEDYQGPNNSNLMLRLGLPWIVGVKLGVYYAKRNFDDVAEAFDLDRGLLIAEGKYKFWGPLFVYAQYAREWKVRDDTEVDNPRYDTVDTWDAGVGVEFTF